MQDVLTFNFFYFHLKTHFEGSWQIFPNLLTSVDNCAFQNNWTNRHTHSTSKPTATLRPFAPNVSAHPSCMTWRHIATWTNYVRSKHAQKQCTQTALTYDAGSKEFQNELNLNTSSTQGGIRTVTKATRQFIRELILGCDWMIRISNSSYKTSFGTIAIDVQPSYSPKRMYKLS